jgi:acyl-CoA synthetase (NDP forming)
MSDGQIHQLIERYISEDRTLLTEVESKQLFKEIGIEVIDTKLATSREEAVNTSKYLGFPVVLKINSPDIIHKTDVGGVRLDLKTEREVAEAFDEILIAVKKKCPGARVRGISVQRMASPGVEIIIGMFRDRQFGPVLMFGLGGVFVEVLKDVSFGILPLTRRDASDMIREIRGYRLLEGYRGHERVDVSNLESLLLKLSDFVERNPEIKEFDLNPIFVYRDRTLILDARVVLEERKQSGE